MKGDFTRNTFDRRKHYTSVRLQQGRVQMDSDWNEQADIEDYLDRTQSIDVIGLCGVPETGGGFEIQITPLSSPLSSPPTGPELLISAGRLYVDGILCENEEPVLFTEQPGLPAAALPTQNGMYVAYLDVWTQHVTALEDAALREVALGGPDTATRTKTVWQVKLLRVGNASAALTCESSFPDFDALLSGPSGRLSARAQEAAASTGPCIIEPGAGFRRLENQLYRVEIHQGSQGGQQPTFKWSRDNGTVVSRWLSRDGNNLTVSSLGRDKLLGFAPGNWVELTDDTHELAGQAGTLVRLVNAVGQTLVVDPATATGTLDPAAFPQNPKVRRWDMTGLTGQIAVEIPAANDGYIPLEDGVEVRFEAGDYRTGDYWLVPARVATGDIEWPHTDPQSPHGIVHHYCRLAMIRRTAAGFEAVDDCRPRFPALTQLASLFYVSGDGQEAMPGQALPRPLQVGVAHGEWPVPHVLVTFTVTGGTGTLTALSSSGSTVSVETDAAGIAQCGWTLDAATGSQQVQASLADGTHLPVRFNANLSLASAVAYTPTNLCPDLVAAKVQTVQQALDQLCQAREREPGIHVSQIVLASGGALRNDTDVPVDRLAQGIRVICDGNLDPSFLNSRDGFPPFAPNCFLSLALPFPLNTDDRRLWGDPVIGFQPLLLAARVTVDDRTLFWTPIDAAQVWLTQRLFSILAQLGRGGRVLARLTLKGNFIWAENEPDRFLDGEVFGFRRDSDRIDIHLPSGDGRRGGDLEMWFWLVPSQALPPSPIGHNLTSVATDIQAGVAGVLGEARLTKVGPEPQATLSSTISFLYLGIQISNVFAGSVPMNPATGTISANGIVIQLTGGWRSPSVSAAVVNTAAGGLLTLTTPQGLIVNAGDFIAVSGINALIAVTGGDVTVSLTSAPSTAHIFVNTSRVVVADVRTGNLILNVTVAGNRVQGLVLDVAGAAIAGASVTLTGATGTRSTVTDAQGAFVFAAVANGAYTVVAQFGGFSAQRNIRVGLIVVTPPTPPILDPVVVAPIRRLDEIEGIGGVLSARLVESGIADPAALASADPARVARILRVTESQARTLIERAGRLVG
jgi:Family of unknown function (DUF6519)/Carboxypeptidase regulatory-like domain/Helix-hairpin-helix domain